jgi:hypothetical protein
MLYGLWLRTMAMHPVAARSLLVVQGHRIKYQVQRSRDSLDGLYFSWPLEERSKGGFHKGPLESHEITQTPAATHTTVDRDPVGLAGDVIELGCDWASRPLVYTAGKAGGLVDWFVSLA